MKRIFITALFISLIGLLNLAAQERIYTPGLSLPENGAVDQMPDVVLDWDAVTGGNTGIIKYDIQLDTDPAFPAPINYQTEFVSAVQTAPLTFGQTYYWHVRAKDGNEISGWSETWSFRVVRRVSLVKPEDASLQNDTTRIIWTAVTGIIEYDYQFDTVYFWKSFSTGVTKNLLGVSVVDATHSWFVGAGGAVYFFDGTTWSEQSSGITTDLNGVSFVDATNGWAVGKGGKIVHYDGSTWTEQTSGTANDLYGVHFYNATNGWAVGKGGTVLYYNGSSWATQYTASKDLNKVFAYDATHVWAVGKNGLIINYNGSAWNVQETGGTIKEFLAVGFSSATDGWAVGKTGFMMHYTGGAWQNFESGPSTKDLTSIFFISADEGYIVGKSGTLLYFDGVDWSNQSSTTSTNLNSVSFNGTTGYLAGENGTVIMFNDEAFSSPLATINHVPVGTTSKKIMELSFGTQYYWRMRMRSEQGLSEWSGARSFNTRSTVALDKPNDADVDQMLDQVLSWKKQFSELVSYEIEVDNDANFSSPVFMETTNININSTLLNFGVEYYWRVRVLHAHDISDWSEVRSFTTINTVVLDSPADNEVDVKLSPLLSWEAQTGVAGYQVQLSGNSAFSEILVDQIVAVAENFLNVPVVLDKDTQHWWRVRAVNGLDSSNWSPIWSFRTVPPVGIEEPGLAGKLNIYPNPAENNLYIDVKQDASSSLQLTLTDLLGKKVIENNMIQLDGNNTIQLDVSDLRNGIYMLRIADGESTFTKKIIINR